MFGKKARQIHEQQEQIERLTAELETLKTENDSLTARIEEYARRESSISRVLTEAAERADVVIADAQRAAGEILEQSQADSDAAKRDAEQIVDDAYQNARDIVKEAEAESQKKLDDTQGQIENYVAMLKSYDRFVQENIKNAEESARRYAEIALQLHAAVPEILSADGKLIEPPAEEQPLSGSAPEPEPANEIKPQTTAEPEQQTETESEPEAQGETPEMAGESAAEPENVLGKDESEKAADEPESAKAEHASGEKVWRVSEIMTETEGEPAQVDAIIEDILQAAQGE